MSQIKKFIPWVIVVVIVIAAVAAIILMPPRVVEMPVEKTVVKEVPVEKVVEKPVVKEVPVEKVVTKEVVKEVPKKIDIVSLQISWLWGGGYAHHWVAVDKGYFEEEGISARLFRGYGGAQTITNVDQGVFEFGQGDFGTLSIAMSKEAHVKAIGVIYANSPQGFASLEEKGITKPKDMEGRKFGIVPSSATKPLFPVFCKVNNVDVNKVEIVSIGAGAEVPLLLSGTTADFFCPWTISTLPPILVGAEKLGKKVNFLAFPDWGMDIYGDSLIASDKLIKENPDLIRRFVRADFKGLAYEISHPEETVDIMLKYNPELGGGDGKAILKLQVDAAIACAKDKGVLEKGLGWIDEEKAKKTRDITLGALDIKAEIPLTDLYTNEFFSGIK